MVLALTARSGRICLYLLITRWGLVMIRGAGLLIIRCLSEAHSVILPHYSLLLLHSHTSAVWHRFFPSCASCNTANKVPVRINVQLAVSILRFQGTLVDVFSLRLYVFLLVCLITNFNMLITSTVFH